MLAKICKRRYTYIVETGAIRLVFQRFIKEIVNLKDGFMTLRSYIWGMRVAVLFSIIALGFAAYLIDPETSGIPGKTLVFLITFFALSGIFNLVLLRLRRKFTTAENSFEKINLSFRQGILLSVFCTGILVFRGEGLLVWWSALLLLAGVFLLELFFVTRK